ncbi:hypothetical protein F5Y19DRAFT_476052 [Xylariaceae sp. FL1651]|nr:hypothetical protein F5Y19DRAFT_476052 [Xylariaceae sp. FL1651]
MAIMDILENAPVGGADGGKADAAGGEGSSSSSISAAPPVTYPQATIPEGLNPPAIFLSTLLPEPSSTSGAGPSRIPTNNHYSPLHLPGPAPQKGSGQDRFRLILEATKENGHPRLTAAAQSKSSTATPTTVPRPMAAPRYSPDLTTVKPPPFTLFTTTSAHPGGIDTASAAAMSSNVKTELPPAVKAEPKDSLVTKHKPTGVELKSSTGCKPTNGSGDNRNHPVATARLSAQCQMRHFNPKWLESSCHDGFKCSVQLVDKIIRGDHAYRTAYDAKQAVAEKALVYVRQLPCKNPSEKVVTKIRSAGQTERISERNQPKRAQVKRESPLAPSHATYHNQFMYTGPPSANVAYPWNPYNNSPEQHALLHRVQSLFGGAGPSPTVLSDPLAAQAFLQGLAVGTSVQVAGSMYNRYIEPQDRVLPSVSGDIYRPYQARERSPAPNPSRNYRDRSSPRRRPESHARPSN